MQVIFQCIQYELNSFSEVLSEFDFQLTAEYTSFTKGEELLNPSGSWYYIDLSRLSSISAIRISTTQPIECIINESNLISVDSEFIFTGSVNSFHVRNSGESIAQINTFAWGES